MHGRPDSSTIDPPAARLASGYSASRWTKFPSRYDVSSGQVLAASGMLFGQWDVLIYNRPDTPLLFNSPAATVLPIEGILAAISVKSSVDKAAIDDAAAAAKGALVDASQPRHPRLSHSGARTHRHLPAYVRVRLHGSRALELIEHAKDAGEQPVKWNGDSEPTESEASVRPSVLTGICVLDSGLCTAHEGDDGQVAIEKIEGYVWADTKSGDGAWGLFPSNPVARAPDDTSDAPEPPEIHRPRWAAGKPWPGLGRQLKRGVRATSHVGCKFVRHLWDNGCLWLQSRVRTSGIIHRAD